MKILSKLNRYIFNMTEIITLLFLSYFSNHLGNGFCIAYALLLIALFYTKLKFVTYETEIPGELTAAFFLCEYSMIFLKYAELPINLYIRQASISIILLFILFSITVVKESSFDVENLTRIVLFSGSVLFLVSVLVHKSTWAIELSKLIFVCTVILFSRRTESQLPILISAALSCVVLMLFVKEMGTAMVIGITTLILIVINNQSTKLTVILLVLSASVLMIWSFIYFNDNIYHMLYHIAPSYFKQALERLFFDYDTESAQIALINNVIDSRGVKNEFFLLIKPTNFVNLIPNSNSETTGVADYIFSLMLFFNGKFLSAVIVFLSAIPYISSIAVRRRKSNLVVPLLILVQCLVHICGNRLIFPFTGVPMIFISYAPAAVLCSLMMLIVSAVTDREE